MSYYIKLIFVFIILSSNVVFAQLQCSHPIDQGTSANTDPTPYGGPDTSNTTNPLTVIVTFVTPKDPNEISGPLGSGPQRFVAKKDNIKYIIRYENDPKLATAPANYVKIVYPIDANQNMQSFRVGDFGFNEYVFTVPPNTAAYSKRLNVVVDSVSLFVDVIAGIDITQQQAFWILESKDPLTGLLHTNPLIGFLPISDSTGTDSTNQGNGFVNFTIKPKNTTHTGDTMHAEASIIFDVNEEIATNVEVHTIDAVAPTSHITATYFQNDTIELHFSAADDVGGSGVKMYDLYVAQDSSNYITYLTNVTDSIVSFHGVPSSTYHFFSLATDNVGNREALKLIPDISVDFLKDMTVIVKAFIEGYYMGNGTLKAVINQSLYPNLCDTLILQLAKSAPPHEILYTDTAILKTNGIVDFHFDTTTIADNYYLILRHRNVLETWNALPLPLKQGTNSYDFTNSITKAYGNNLRDLGDGNYALYSGDVNQNGIIDENDFTEVKNLTQLFLSGYLIDDITGDWLIESSDFSLIENNLGKIMSRP